MHGGQHLSTLAEQVADQIGTERERLQEVLAKLWDRGLLIEGRINRSDPDSQQLIAPPVASVSFEPSALLTITTPRLFRLYKGRFEPLAHEGRIKAQLSAVELAAASEFRQGVSAQSALEAHRLSCGSLALDESSFHDLLHRLGAAELLQRTDSKVSEGRSEKRRGGEE